MGWVKGGEFFGLDTEPGRSADTEITEPGSDGEIGWVATDDAGKQGKA